MRVTLKAVNAQLKSLGFHAELTKGDGYFYFSFGEAADWLNTAVRVDTLSSLTLEQWVEEFKKLKALNESLSGKPEGKRRTVRKTR